MRRMLFITNFSDKRGCENKITSFSQGAFEASQALGLCFHMNTNKEDTTPQDENKNVVYHNVGIYRNPFSLDVLKAYFQLVKICKENKFDMIHCNTPIGGVLGRLAAKRCGIPHVVYQAHGFHFYKGAPIKNWILYYPIERVLAYDTDAIITINREDYKRAKKFHLRNHGKVYYVPGVGIDTSQYSTDLRQKDNIQKEIQSMPFRMCKRLELGIPFDAKILISVGELNTNKNNKVIISALGKLEDPSVHYILCGTGECENQLRNLAKELNVKDQVHFLGYRTDVKELLKASDIFVMPSIREGLSRSLMEAMACGIPCVVSDIRGNRDLIHHNKGGYLCELNDDSFAESFSKLIRGGKELGDEMGTYNLKRIKNYDICIVRKKIMNIYKELLLQT